MGKSLGWQIANYRAMNRALPSSLFSRLAAGQALWYRLVLFGKEEYGRHGFLPDGYMIVVGDNGDALTDNDY